MGKCRNHPERETSYYCQKYHHYLCAECLHCQDPKLYCKHRPNCIISFKEKRGFKDEPED